MYPKIFRENAMPAKTQKLSASLEDYLEVIYHIADQKGAARARDIGLRLGVAPPSVTAALKLLADKKLINYVPYDVITLTPYGHQIVADVIHRHEALRDFLMNVLDVSPEQAEPAACKMEHAVPTDIIERLIDFTRRVRKCPNMDCHLKSTNDI